jgi:PAS domain-containing protein
MVIAGPNRGTSYALQGGETAIGRQPGNEIVLPSSKVSRRHCVLVVNNEDILLRDEGSANGTFVNGVLTRTKKLAPGDRVSVGEFVLELKKAAQAKLSQAPAVGMDFGNVIPFPSSAPGGFSTPSSGASPQTPSYQGELPPQDLKGKIIWGFEKYVMPMFYSWNLSTDWKTIWIVLVLGFLAGNVLISVFPLLEANRATIVRETGQRARGLARQLAERNQTALALNQPAKTTIGNVEYESGVVAAAITDMKLTIQAPGNRVGKVLSGTDAAIFAAAQARNYIKGGEFRGRARQVNDKTVAAVEPIVAYDQGRAQMLPVGLAVVVIDLAASLPEMGELGLIYSKTMILSGLLGAFIFFVLFRMTVKPFEVLNEDIDKALKGEASQVTRSFKREEFEQLLDAINSALQRAGRAGSGDAGGEPQGISAAEILQSFRPLGEIPKLGVMFLDAEKRIAFLNPVFEEISGIRSDSAVGQEISMAARDQAFASFVNDLYLKAESSIGMGVTEDFDFNGDTYRIQMIAHHASTGFAYIVTCSRKEG